MKIYLNGKIVEEAEAKISVFDRSYLHGEGLYETLRSSQGRIPFLAQHLGRMEWSATFIGIPFPHPTTIENAIHEVLKVNNLKDARIKILLSAVSRGMKPQLPTEDSEINLTIMAEKFTSWPDSDYEEGVELCIIRTVKADMAPVANMKTTSMMNKMIARREIAERSVFDGILLDAAGHVSETTVANIFWVEKQTVFTPPLSTGLLTGVTRQVVMQAVQKEGLVFREANVTVEELLKKEEVFITNALVDIMPVTVIQEQEVGSGEVGKVTRGLMESYQELVKKEIN